MWPATVHSCWERFFVRCAPTKQSISWATSPGCGSMTVPMAFRENRGTHKKLDLAKEKVGLPVRWLHTQRKTERWGKRVWRQGRGKDKTLKPKWWTKCYSKWKKPNVSLHIIWLHWHVPEQGNAGRQEGDWWLPGALGEGKNQGIRGH